LLGWARPEPGDFQIRKRPPACDFLADFIAAPRGDFVLADLNGFGLPSAQVRITSKISADDWAALEN
jgi:hypothetical protein